MTAVDRIEGEAPRPTDSSPTIGNPESPSERYSFPPGIYVAGGAVVGTAARALLDALTQPWLVAGIHWSTITVNLLGAFAMGFLTAWWMRERGQNAAWDRLKLLFGTGTLGAFTTYSAFALAVANSATVKLSLLLASMVVLAGICAVAAGIWGANQWLSARAKGRAKQ